MEFNRQKPYNMAGSAVAAIHFGIEFERVSAIAAVIGDPTQWGVDEDHRDGLIDRWVVILLCGDSAEEMQTGVPVEESEALLISFFLATARSPQATNEEIQRYLDWQTARSRNLVAQDEIWEKIERVAAAIQERRELNYADISSF